MSKFKLPYSQIQRYFYPIQSIIILVLIVPFSFLLKDYLLVSISLPIIFLATIIINSIRLYNSKGIIVNNEFLEIFDRKKAHPNTKIPFTEIKEIIYNSGINKRDRYLKIKLVKDVQIKILYSDTSQNLAKLLKFLYTKDINITMNTKNKNLYKYISNKSTEFKTERRI